MRVKMRSYARELRDAEMRLDKMLVEAQQVVMDSSSPMADYWNEMSDSEWLPVGQSYLDGCCFPFSTEEQLAKARRRCRKLATCNPYAKNMINNLLNFVVGGNGHTYEFSPMEDAVTDKAAARLARMANRWLKTLLQRNRWRLMEREAFCRVHRDGEAFIRSHRLSTGMTVFRFVEPSEVETPDRLSSDADVQFGVRYHHDDDQLPIAYFISGEEVSALDVQHRKNEVDFSSPRGVSTLFTIEPNLERAQKLLKNMSVVVQIQSAIAMIRRHAKASPRQAENFSASRALLERTNAITGKIDRYSKLPAGAVIDVTGDVEYDFPATGLDPSRPIEVLQAELRAVASSKGMPEFMIGSDASNANYSSTLVAESPATKMFQREQSDLMDHNRQLIIEAAEYAVTRGRLPADVMDALELVITPPSVTSHDPAAQAQTNQIYHEMRAKSLKTIQQEIGLDVENETGNFRDEDDAHPAGSSLVAALPQSGDEGTGSAATSVQETGLNGAQIASLTEIIASVSAGTLPKASARAMIIAAFPLLDHGLVDQMLGPIRGGASA